MYLVEPAQGTFTPRELARLTAYRSAVAAGFYTDWDGTAISTDTQELAWLGSPSSGPADGEYPFTPEERLRLERCRVAVAGGYYSDDQPPADPSATSDQPTR
jgi:hypothetical protein